MLSLLLACTGPTPALEVPTPVPAPPAELQGAEEGPPDWDNAAHLETEVVSEGVLLRVVLEPGFHVYGAKEEIGNPLTVRVTDQPDVLVHVPDGEPKELPGLGTAWVLSGTVELVVPVATPAAGQVELQICTVATCSRPTTWDWSAEGL